MRINPYICTACFLLLVNLVGVYSIEDNYSTRSALDVNVTVFESCPCCLGSGMSPSPDWVNYGGFIILTVTVIAMFWALALVCEDYFVPALNVLCEEWNIPSDVAGATFMAAGASSPELFTSLIGLLIYDSNIGVGTVVGSEIFNHMIISAGSVLYAKNGVLVLDSRIVMRDLIAYMFSTFIFIYTVENDIPGSLRKTFNRESWHTCLSVTTLHAAVLLIMYCVYAIICGNFQRLTSWFCPRRPVVVPKHKTGGSIEEGTMDDTEDETADDEEAPKLTATRAEIQCSLNKPTFFSPTGHSGADRKVTKSALMSAMINASMTAEQDKDDDGSGLSGADKQRFAYMMLAMGYRNHTTVSGKPKSAKWRKLSETVKTGSFRNIKSLYEPLDKETSVGSMLSAAMTVPGTEHVYSEMHNPGNTPVLPTVNEESGIETNANRQLDAPFLPNVLNKPRVLPSIQDRRESRIAPLVSDHAVTGSKLVIPPLLPLGSPDTHRIHSEGVVATPPHQLTMTTMDHSHGHSSAHHEDKHRVVRYMMVPVNDAITKINDSSLSTQEKKHLRRMVSLNTGGINPSRFDGSPNFTQILEDFPIQEQGMQYIY